SAMSQSARLRNLSAWVMLSTAMMSASPRAFSPLTRFDPMKPAAPVTTMYTIHPFSVHSAAPLLHCGTPGTDVSCGVRTCAAHGERYTRRDGAQQFVSHRS